MNAWRQQMMQAAAVLLILPAIACGRAQPTPAELPPARSKSASPVVSAPRMPDKPKCALIDTDDDIPSGSPTAGALYVPDADLGRRLLTKDVIAAGQGFADAGLCVIVLDSHDGALDQEPIKALGWEVWTPSNHTPWTWPFFGDAPSHVSIVAMIGYHSRQDQPSGFRPHTINDSVVDLRLNGTSVGEVTNMMMGYGAFGLPVGLVSGDRNATAEAAAIVPSVQQVTVRWRDPEGNAAFLTTDQAGQLLREGARKAAANPPPPYHPATPLTVQIRIYSKRMAEKQAQSLADVFRKRASNWKDHPLLQGFDMQPLKVEGSSVGWTAPNGLAAFVSVTAAASHLRGPEIGDLVSKGIDAYNSQKYDDALAAFKEAMDRSPLEVSLGCRIGRVSQKRGLHAKAQEAFRKALETEDEMAPYLRSLCWLGLAESEAALKHVDAARQAAERVLAFSNAPEQHRTAASKLLAELGKSPRAKP